MRKLDYPLAPAVLAIVLGPLAETSMRQALLMSDGSLMIFFERVFLMSHTEKHKLQYQHLLTRERGMSS